MEFKDFIKDQAIADKIPFSVDLQPVSNEDGAFVNVGKFQLPKYDELLTREDWFFNFLREKAGHRRIELQIEIFSVAKLLKEELQIETDSKALKILSELTAGGREIPDSETPDERIIREASAEKEQSFFMKYLDRFMKLSEMVQAIEENAVESWIRITFFLLSRYDANWTFTQTASLRKSEISSLIDFINTEANGGVPIVQEEDSDLDLGKELTNLENSEAPPELDGAKSTGALVSAAS